MSTPMPVNERIDKVMARISIYVQSHDVSEIIYPILYDGCDITNYPCRTEFKVETRFISDDAAVSQYVDEFVRWFRGKELVPQDYLYFLKTYGGLSIVNPAVDCDRGFVTVAGLGRYAELYYPLRLIFLENIDEGGYRDQEARYYFGSFRTRNSNHIPAHLAAIADNIRTHRTHIRYYLDIDGELAQNGDVEPSSYKFLAGLNNDRVQHILVGSFADWLEDMIMTFLMPSADAAIERFR